MTFQAGSIKTSIVGDTGPLGAAFAKAEGMAQGFAGSIGAILGGVAAAASVAGVAASVKASLHSIDDASKVADRLGLSTQAYVALTHQADLAGVAQEELGMSLQHLQGNLIDAAKGAGSAGPAFARLGLDAKSLANADLDAVVGKIGDTLQGVPNATERASLAMDLFGARGGPKLLALLSEGSEGMKKAKAEAEALGIAFGRDAGKKVEEANDAVTRATAAFKGLAVTAAITLAPQLQHLAELAMGVGVSIRSIEPGALSVAGSMVKWAAGIGAAVLIAPRLVAAAGAIIKAFQALAETEAIVLSLGGPAGWATLATGIAIAAGSVYLLDKTFASATANAQAAAAAATKAGQAAAGVKLPTIGGVPRIGPPALAAPVEGLTNFNDELARTVGQLQAAALEAGKTEEEVALMRLQWMGADSTLLGYARSALAAKKAGDDLAESQKKAADNAKAATDRLQQMRDQVATFGFTEGQKAAFDFKGLNGKSLQQLEEFEKLAKRLDQLNEDKKFKDRAEEIKKGLETPEQTFRRTVEELQKLRDKDLISEEVYQRGVKKAREEAGKATEQEGGGQRETKFASFLRAGSNEAAKFLFAAQNDARREEVPKQQLRKLDDIWREVRDQNRKTPEVASSALNA